MRRILLGRFRYGLLAEIGRRFDLPLQAVSAFKVGRRRFPPSKLASLETFLRRCPVDPGKDQMAARALLIKRDAIGLRTKLARKLRVSAGTIGQFKRGHRVFPRKKLAALRALLLAEPSRAELEADQQRVRQLFVARNTFGLSERVARELSVHVTCVKEFRLGSRSFPRIKLAALEELLWALPSAARTHTYQERVRGFLVKQNTRGLSQRIARELGVGASTVKRFLSGEGPFPQAMLPALHGFLVRLP